MALIIQPPAPPPWKEGVPILFLAGSIEMGQAANWQDVVARSLDEFEILILNPRRDEWDANWVQSIHNPQFKEQVEWELEGQERADWIAMYFDPETRAPVTMLELGLFARSGKLLVCCPEGFWRKGNVEVVCARYGVPLAATIPEMIALLQQRCISRE